MRIRAHRQGRENLAQRAGESDYARVNSARLGVKNAMMNYMRVKMPGGGVNGACSDEPCTARKKRQ
jgi:hypothetical protein